MERIFTYGTLQDTQIQMRLIGRTLGEGRPDSLPDYKMAKLVSVEATYNIIQPQAGASVDGIVYEVTPDELLRLDVYEGDAYMRVSANLVSNTRAWVYRDNPDSVYQSHIQADE